MISKIVKGNGFKGARDYIYDKNDAELLFAKNLFTDNHAGEMRACANSSKAIKPVFHATLSLEPGEFGTEEQWQDAVEDYLTEMGFDTKITQYSITRHKDTGNDHVHILANRVLLNGKLVPEPKKEYRLSKKATRAAELAGNFNVFDPNKPKANSGKFSELRRIIDEALDDSYGNYAEFKDLLFEQKITVIENRQKSGINGLSFQMQGEKFHKGSELGKTYSAAGLRIRGLAVNPSLESDNLAKLRAKRGSQPGQAKPF